RTLHQWITGHKIGRNDEISRSGHLWRKLDAVPEFQGFFPAAIAADPALPFQSTAPDHPGAPRLETRRSTAPFEPAREVLAATAPPLSAPPVPPAAPAPPAAESEYSLGSGAHEPAAAGPAWAESGRKGAAARDPAAQSGTKVLPRDESSRSS